MELFNEFWWLLLPLSAIAFGAFRRWLAYRARRDALDLIKTYAESGREPPAALVDRLSLRGSY